MRISYHDVQKIMDLTDANEHSAAVAYLASLTGDGDLAVRAATVYRDHMREGYLTPSASKERDAIMGEAFLMIDDSDVDPALFAAIRRAF